MCLFHLWLTCPWFQNSQTFIARASAFNSCTTAKFWQSSGFFGYIKKKNINNYNIHIYREILLSFGRRMLLLYKKVFSHKSVDSHKLFHGFPVNPQQIYNPLALSLCSMLSLSMRDSPRWWIRITKATRIHAIISSSPLIIGACFTQKFNVNSDLAPRSHHSASASSVMYGLIFENFSGYIKVHR